jgi:hypothetical protein
MTYNLIRIGTGGSGITGTFAGLPVSGSSLSASFGGTSYPFTVNYGTNLIAITAIPEPTTYALFAAGLAVLVGWRRRR